MNVLILAFDALEYDIVVGMKLKPLMQEYYGRYEAVTSPRYGKPHTPSAWTTIITGRSPEEHGIDYWWTYGRFLDWLRTKPPLVWIKNKRRILWKLGLKPRVPDKRDLKFKTIFDLVDRSVALFVPGYNEPVWPHEKLNEAFRKGLREYVKTIWEIHEWRKRVFFEKLGGDWELFMAWFDLADLLGHVCITKCRTEFLKAYIELSKIAKKVRDMYRNKDVFILILSDHGMKPVPDGTGDHSSYGFWSANKKPPFTPRKATDFYKLVEEVLAS